MRIFYCLYYFLLFFFLKYQPIMYKISTLYKKLILLFIALKYIQSNHADFIIYLRRILKMEVNILIENFFLNKNFIK